MRYKGIVTTLKFKEYYMISTIFSGLPIGVSVRRLDESRKVNRTDKAFKWTAWIDHNGTYKRAYGNSMREAVRKLGQDFHAVIQ